ncbi:MAG: alpha/beta hydrolase [Pseudomonadota bacterium]
MRVCTFVWLAVVLAGCSPIHLVNTLSPSSHYQMASSVAYGSDQRQTLDVYVPTQVALPAPVVVFFYGGGWEDGKKRDYEFVASSLTDAGYVVVVPDYRLYPDVVFPAFVEDGAAAIAWTMRNVKLYGGDATQLFLMGHSAGAHIAAMLSADPQYLAAQQIDVQRLSGLIGLSGPYDFLPLNEDSYLAELFPAATRDASQPINFASAAMPPTLLIHGTGDDVVEVGNSERFAARLTEVGADVTLKRYDGVGHAAVAAALSPPLDFTNSTLEDSRAFLDANSSSAD